MHVNVTTGQLLWLLNVLLILTNSCFRFGSLYFFPRTFFRPHYVGALHFLGRDLVRCVIVEIADADEITCLDTRKKTGECKTVENTFRAITQQEAMRAQEQLTSKFFFYTNTAI